MRGKFKIKIDNIVAFTIWLVIIIVALINNSVFESSSKIIVIAFLVFELFISFFSKSIRRSLPMIIIQVTGLIRYIIIPIVIKSNYIIYGYSNRVIELMVLELIAVYFGTLLYALKSKNKEENDTEKILKINEKVNQRWGLSAIITIMIGRNICHNQ